MRIGVPAGSSSLLKHVPLPIRQSWRETLYESRSLQWSYGGHTYFALRPKVIPALVANGVLDEGFCGSDSLNEFLLPELLVSEQLAPQTNVRMVVAAADPLVLEHPRGRPLVVGTSYPAVASAVLDVLGKAYLLVEQPGCIEGLCPLLVDLVIDVTETGETLRANNLTVLHDLGELSVVKIRRRG